jgi:ABC-type Fe3+-hydroxamate transport system substrate-binding protein
MKKSIYIILLVFLIAVTTSCKRDNEFCSIKSTGIVEKQGITTYMYGTHILVDKNGKTIYALNSEKLNLDNYLKKNVEIIGYKIKGYPVDGGPEYLEAISVK